MSNSDNPAKHAADVVAVLASVSSGLQLIAPVFGLIGCIWTVMRIAEMVSGLPFHEIIRRRRKPVGKD
jgi:hypothetical protein